MSGRIENRLNELGHAPELAPPAALEPRVLAAMAAASASRRTRPLAEAAAWIVVLGAAALIGALAFIPREPVAPQPDVAATEAIYTELLEQSAYLEQLLAALPQRQLMRVSTAGTIVGLEDRIAMIDAELVGANAATLPPEYRVALLQDRVDVMNALVSVRYAQSQVMSF